MKLYKLLLIALLVVVTGCLETESTTAINKDGSGTLTSTIDLGKMIEMMMKGKDVSKEKDFQKDTIVYFRTFSDTASALSAREKDLVRDISVQINIKIKSSQMRLTIKAPFKNLSDLGELNQLMTKRQFDDLFDRATRIPELTGDDDEKKSGKNDNLFGSVFPDFYDCTYKKGAINCTFNKDKYDQTLTSFADRDMKPDDEIMEKLFGEAQFTNRIVTPTKARNITGTTLRAVSETEYVQTGTLLEMYRTPEKFTYSLEY